LLVAAKPDVQDLNLARIASPGGDQSRVDPGDLVEVTIASGRDGEEPAPVATRIADNGAADIPLVGQVQLSGLEPFEAGQRIAKAAVERGIYRRPHVSLEIKSKAVNRVTVMGAVDKPGVYELPRASSDLVSALASAGGLTEEADTVVEIVRPAAPPGALFDVNATPPSGYDGIQQVDYQFAAAGQSQRVRVDLAGAAPTLADYRLGDRDMVVAPTREKEVIFVTGLVTEPGQFELPAKQDVHLLDAVAMAGGISVPVADKVLIIRRRGGRPEPVPIEASLSAAKRNGRENLLLGAGDVVSVEQTPATAVVDTFIKLFRVSFGMASTGTLF
jgi:polysaccharide export outer membrane protein